MLTRTLDRPKHFKTRYKSYYNQHPNTLNLCIRLGVEIDQLEGMLCLRKMQVASDRLRI